MAGSRCRLDASAAEQQGESKADEAKRGLGMLGEAQLVVGGAGEQVTQVDTCR